MTFGELITLVRREIIVDDYEDAFTTADIRDALWRASIEVAAAFDFPRAITTIVVAADAMSFAAPADCAAVTSVSISGDDGRPVDVQHIYRMSPGISRPLRYFNWDPRRADTVLIAPPSQGGNAVVEYTTFLTRPATNELFDAAEPWDGVLQNFVPIIAYRAGIFLFQMDERENETEHWQREYQTRMQEMAAFLNRTDMSNLIVSFEARNDRGAEG